MKEAGRFQPGQSGNPKGRPPGAGQLGTLRASIVAHVPEIVARLVDAAKAGDVGAARLLLERVLPAVKPIEQEVVIALPTGSLTDQGRAVLAAAGAGELATGQAAQLLTGLSSLAKLVETDELAARIKALETRDGNVKS